MISQNLKLLIIEKDRRDYEGIRSYFSEDNEYSFKFRWATSAKKGLNLLRSFIFDLILLDLDLPDGSAVKILRQLIRMAPDTPVVVLARKNDKQLASAVIKEGAQDFLVKGEFDSRTLGRALFHAIERFQLRRQLEQQKIAAEAGEKHLEDIINASLDGIVVFSNPAGVLVQNEAARLFLGNHISDFMEQAAVSRSAELSVLELNLAGGDGQYRTLDIRTIRISWADSNDACLSVIRDVSQQRELDRVLRENDEKFRAIAGSAIDAIIQLDQDGRVVFWNEAAEKMFGYRAEEIQGRELHPLLAPADRQQEYRKGIQKFRKTGTGRAARRLMEFEALHKNGKIVPIEVSFSPIRLKGQWHAIGIVRDTSERKAFEQRLLQTRERLKKALEKLKCNQNKLLEMETLKNVQALAASVSHEFAQPLQALSNCLCLLENKGSDPVLIRRSKQMIDRIVNLNNQLLGITSLEKKNYFNTEMIDFAATSRDQSGQTRRVLVLDDEKEILETLTEMFRLNGYECDGARSGQEGLELFNKNKYWLIVSDVMMPEMSGPEFFRQVKKSGYNSYFIFLTGYNLPAEEKSIVNQADAVIMKPFSFDSFFRQLEKISSSAVTMAHN